jgi:hypothetical protein
MDAENPAYQKVTERFCTLYVQDLEILRKSGELLDERAENAASTRCLLQMLAEMQEQIDKGYKKL